MIHSKKFHNLLRKYFNICLHNSYAFIGLHILYNFYICTGTHGDRRTSQKTVEENMSIVWLVGLQNSSYVETPLFIAQNRYDSNQMGNEFLCVGCSSNETAASKKVRQYMSYFGKHTEATLRDLEHSFGHSVFMPNCFQHTDNLCMSGGLAIEQQTYRYPLSAR